MRLEHAAARPAIVPETVVVDRGRVYLSETFIRACENLGISVQPTHPASGAEKGNVERTFESINTLFCQQSLGMSARMSPDAARALRWNRFGRWRSGGTRVEAQPAGTGFPPAANVQPTNVATPGGPHELAGPRWAEVGRPGLTQADVADRMHVRHERVSAIERGRVDTSELRTLAAYIRALGGRMENHPDFGGQRLVVG